MALGVDRRSPGSSHTVEGALGRQRAFYLRATTKYNYDTAIAAGAHTEMFSDVQATASAGLGADGSTQHQHSVLGLVQ